MAYDARYQKALEAAKKAKEDAQRKKDEQKAAAAAKQQPAEQAAESSSDSEPDSDSSESEAEEEPVKAPPAKKKSAKKVVTKAQPVEEEQAEVTQSSHPLSAKEASASAKQTDLSADYKRYIRLKSAKYVEQEVTRRMAQLEASRNAQQTAQPAEPAYVTAARERLGRRVLSSTYGSIFPYG